MSETKNNELIFYFPYKEDSNSYYIPKNKTEYEVCEQGLAIPPKDLWLGYGSVKEEYLSWGKLQVEKMLEIVEKTGFDFSAGKRILDLGCGAGRMIRWLKPLTDKCEIWGTDISSEHIYWANNYLKPPFNFATTTTLPHLPFEDRYFDFIYGGSVFTHIDDLADSWLLELRRVLNKDGLMYITLHDRNSIRLLDSHAIWKDSWLAKFMNGIPLYSENKDDFGIIVGGRGPASQVFYDIDYFKNSVKSIFDVLSVNEEAYGYQTAVVLRKK